MAQCGQVKDDHGHSPTEEDHLIWWFEDPTDRRRGTYLTKLKMS